MIRYIDQYGEEFGVEPICQVLAIAPSTYYEARSRSASARRQRDAELQVEIERVRKENFEVYLDRMLLAPSSLGPRAGPPPPPGALWGRSAQAREGSRPGTGDVARVALMADAGSIS